MAHKGFSGSSAPMSYKQCLLSKEMHFECLDEMKSENNYLCPDTWEAYKRWCPEDVRSRLHYKRNKDLYNRSIWANNTNLG